MEIQFRQEGCQYLRRAVCQYQTQEQTQEVRLPEAMPDIGKVLGCWGQVLIRGKEWRGSGMTVSGGVMAWVLYAPEDGSEPASVECWIPFQLKWDFPQTERDGFICVEPMLRSIDARSTSARKLMVRADVGATGEALEPTEARIAVAESLSEDLQLLQSSYPMTLPLESGEKLFDLEEELPLPEGTAQPEKVMRCAIEPVVMEHKVMAGRLVFRGKATVHMLYRGEDGMLHSWQCELPFSQYTQLDRDFSSGSDARVQVVLTSLDLQRDENHRMQLKCQMAGQYVIYDRVMVDITEDAYSTNRSVELQTQELMLPMRLDQLQQELTISAGSVGTAQQVLDVSYLTDEIRQVQNGSQVQLTVPVHLQVLYYDENGALQCAAVRAEGSCEIASDPGNLIQSRQRLSQPQAYLGADGITASCECQLEMDVFAEQGLIMVTGMEVGETIQPDPNRPSLILRSGRGERLWDIAKECGTTVEAIRAANQLTQEPAKGQMLLIPVP